MGDGVDGALEMNAAGAFDEDDIAGADILREPLARSIGVAKKDCWNSAGASGRGQMFCVALNGDNEIEAGLGSGASACDVKSGAVLAHFEHLAGDKNAAAFGGTRSEGVDHGAKGFGVGVVAVVEDGCAGDLEDLAALVTGSK
jgi:hypothetical protein